MKRSDLLALQRLLKHLTSAHVQLRMEQTASISPAARLALRSIEAAREIVRRALVGGPDIPASHSTDQGTGHRTDPDTDSRPRSSGSSRRDEGAGDASAGSMPVLHCNCRVAFFYADGSEVFELACTVTLDGDGIRVEYDDDAPVAWHGHGDGAGHFVLTCGERNVHATLHRAGNSDILEGFWNEDNSRGMWRIHLAR